MKKVNFIWTKLAAISLGAVLIGGVGTTVTSLSPSREVEAAGPYYLSGTFNAWHETNTPMTSALSSTVYYYEVDISTNPNWNISDRRFKVNPGWLSNLNNQGRAIGFGGGGGSDITYPGTPESGTYVITIRDNDTKDINAYKNAYLTGSFNSWTAGAPSYKMSKTGVLTFTFTRQFATTDEWKIVFSNVWTGELGSGSLSTAAKALNFGGDGGTSNIKCTGVTPGYYDVTLTAGTNVIDIVASAPTTYTVTKYNGATQIGTEVALASAESYVPTFIYQQGYKLEGWYTDSGLTTAWTNGPVSGNMNLYAKYTAASDYYVFFRKPDAWGASINAHYWWQGTGAILGGGTTWPGLPMTVMMSAGHGYVIKIDAGYSPNKIIFNDGTSQTDNTSLEAGKVYSHSAENVTSATSFEYRLFKSWAQWDDTTSALKATVYDAGSPVTVAIKAGDTVKMNISSLIWAPFAKLAGAAASSFEDNVADGNYKAKVDGVFTFTWNQSFTLGSATSTRTAQISADASSVTVVATPAGAAKTDAVNQRIAEINTCSEYSSYSTYQTFVISTLGSLEALTSANQTKMALMNAYNSNPPFGGFRSSPLSSNENSEVLMIIVGAIGLLIVLTGIVFLKRKSNYTN